MKINQLAKFLMDQKHVSGVGNYIKSESLYISKISPHRKLKDINEDELKSLFNAIKKVIISSYKSQGMSLRDYKDFEDKPGEYQFKLVVYGRKFDDLGNKVKTETTKDKRTTHWVPEVQIQANKFFTYHSLGLSLLISTTAGKNVNILL